MVSNIGGRRVGDSAWDWQSVNFDDVVPVNQEQPNPQNHIDFFSWKAAVDLNLPFLDQLLRWYHYRRHIIGLSDNKILLFILWLSMISNRLVALILSLKHRLRYYHSANSIRHRILIDYQALITLIVIVAIQPLGNGVHVD